MGSHSSVRCSVAETHITAEVAGATRNKPRIVKQDGAKYVGYFQNEGALRSHGITREDHKYKNYVVIAPG